MNQVKEGVLEIPVYSQTVTSIGWKIWEVRLASQIGVGQSCGLNLCPVRPSGIFKKLVSDSDWTRDIGLSYQIADGEKAQDFFEVTRFICVDSYSVFLGTGRSSSLPLTLQHLTVFRTSQKTAINQANMAEAMLNHCFVTVAKCPREATLRRKGLFRLTTSEMTVYYWQAPLLWAFMAEK